MMASNGTPPTPAPGPLTSAIAAALESNAALQSELKRRLLDIKRRKAQNRRDAARIAASASSCCGAAEEGAFGRSEFQGGGHDIPAHPSLHEDAHGKSGPVKGTGDEMTVHVDGDGVCANPEPKSQKKGEPEPTAKLPQSKKRAAIPNRRGTRGFFVDQAGSTPDICYNDIVGNGGAPETEEAGRTARVVFERKPQASQGKPQATRGKAKKKKRPSSFEEVALRIDRTSPEPQENRPTAQFTFAAGMANARFNKKESHSIMSEIDQLGGSKQGFTNWHDLAAKHAKFTPWQIFCHYRSTLQHPPSRIPPWSPDEDELLLKYIAAHGPQYAFQGDDMVQLCNNLFPLRNPAQLNLRTSATLLNPNYLREDWDTDEKRKLALLMRVYSDEKKPVNAASQSVHFPLRATKSVSEKWERTLDPALSHRPLAAEEDGELHEESNGSSVRKKVPRTRKRRRGEVADGQTGSL